MHILTTTRDVEHVLWRRDLAARYGVSRETVWRWQQAGKIPPPDVRIGERHGWRTETIRRHESAKSSSTKPAA